jgi:uncharacterized protein YoaH (UPF0181 family)
MAMSGYRNPDGKTYDGVRLMSDLTGGVISQAETRWTFERLKQLMVSEGKSKEEATAIVAAEARSRPWR